MHARSLIRRHIALMLVAGWPALATGAAQAQTSGIPLCPGLQIVTAVNQPNGDYESIKTVEAVDGRTVRIRYSSEHLVTDFLAPDFGKVRKTDVVRSVRREDLQSARAYQQRFFAGMPQTVPETTAIGVSSSVLTALRKTGTADLAISNAYSGDIPADRNVTPSLYDFLASTTIERVGSQPVKVPVLVNGIMTTLSAVHARGDFAGDRSEFFFLDDPANPLTLKFRIGIDGVQPMIKEEIEQCRELARANTGMNDVLNAICGRTQGGDREVLEVVKITHRCAQPAMSSAAGTPGGAPAGQGGALPGDARGLEQALATSGRVEIYDIHFSFNSDRIREESMPRVAEIAAVLKQHPDWTLAVGGHTDSIGGDDFNLDLSRRRAAAVKDVLVKKHGVAPGRLESAGFGETQPRDTNETLQGRARNRRVELIKR